MTCEVCADTGEKSTKKKRPITFFFSGLRSATLQPVELCADLSLKAAARPGALLTPEVVAANNRSLAAAAEALPVRHRLWGLRPR